MFPRLFVIRESKRLMYINCVLYCMIYCTGSFGFIISMAHRIFEKMKVKELLCTKPQDSANGPLDNSWNRAFCYRSPAFVGKLRGLV